jgi:multidrug efflux pump subunit AcrA (membrane-fusion protein)
MAVLTAIAIAATAGGLYYANRATNQQARANEFQRRQANLSASQNRRQQVRQNRLALAQSQVSAEAGGVSRSSGAQGGQASIQSQGLSNLAFLDTMNKLSDQASSALGKSIKLSGYSNMFMSVANMASSFDSANSQVKDQSPKTSLKHPAPISYRGNTPTQSHSVGKGMIY